MTSHTFFISPWAQQGTRKWQTRGRLSTSLFGLRCQQLYVFAEETRFERFMLATLVQHPFSSRAIGTDWLVPLSALPITPPDLSFCRCLYSDNVTAVGSSRNRWRVPHRGDIILPFRPAWTTFLTGSCRPFKTSRPSHAQRRRCGAVGEMSNFKFLESQASTSSCRRLGKCYAICLA